MPEKLLPPGVSIVDSSEAGSLVPNFHLQVGQLNLAKRGDFVRLLLKFTETREGAEPNLKAFEFITCVVTSKTAANGLWPWIAMGPGLRCKVYSKPEKTRFHSVDYGDELTLAERHVMSHEVSTDKVIAEIQPFLSGVQPETVPINAEDAKLRQATQNLAPLMPEPGKQYWTRNGTLVTVWTYQTQKITACRGCTRQLLGSNIQNEMCPTLGTYHDWREVERSVWLGGSADGAAIEWGANGAHAGGIRDLDIVKDPRANEVVA